MENNRKSALESTLGSTPDSTPISETTPKSTLGSTFGGFPVLGSLAGRQTLNFCHFFRHFFARLLLPDSFKFRSLEKGLADRGGWRKEVPPTPSIQAFFLPPFSYAPLGTKRHSSG